MDISFDKCLLKIRVVFLSSVTYAFGTQWNCIIFNVSYNICFFKV